MIASPGRVAALLFVSGFCALVYQIAWLREFRLVFGASTAASAAVVAIFIGGLGAGGLLLGRRVDRHSNPLQLYARLETLISLAAAFTPVLLWVVRRAYVLAGGTPALGLAGGTVVRLLLAALVLAVPTWLMGGTLPAAARAVATSGDPGRRHTALLYGVNTLGAVAGSFVGTFFMLEVFGTQKTLWLACCANLLLALVARQMSRRLAAGTEAPEAEAPSEPVAPPAPTWFVLTAAAGVGFAFFLMELVWYRMLGPILGGTIYTFGLILTVALLGIGLGSAAYARFRRDRPATVLGFANTCLLEAAFIAIPYALGDRIALLAVVLRPLGQVGLFWGHVLNWTIVSSLVILPAAVVAGYQFPMLIALLGRGRREIGRQVGLAYAWNTAGAIVGSLAGGFGLIPLLSAPGTWRATVLVLVALGLTAAGLTLRSGGARGGLAVPAALGVSVLLMLQATGPTAFWRHAGIGVGRLASPALLNSPNDLQSALHFQRRILHWEADGLESSVALEAMGPGLAFVINGKIDGNARGDAPTMIMSGLVGAALHPHPRSALVIGLGTGGTAGWLASVPSIERTEVIELEHLVLQVARDCAPVNRNAMDNPRIKVMVGDAREVLLTKRDTYDVIFSEPSNPYRAGIASLFTREYYEAAVRRLAPGGLFLQWIQAYEVDGRTIRTVYATLASVFPEVETWQVGPGDLLLVASREPIRYDATALRARLAEEPFRSGIRHSWRTDDLEGFLSYFVARSSLARDIAAQERHNVNTDDHNIVEFGFARTVGAHGLFGIAELREVARARAEDRPALAEGNVDWARVDADRLRFYPVADNAPSIHAALSEEGKALAAAMAAGRDYDSARFSALWKAVGREPRTLEEVTAVAANYAGMGDEAALSSIQRLGALEPVEGDAVLAMLRMRQGRGPEALPPLERALTAYRTDPWPAAILMSGAIDLCPELAATDPSLAPRLLSLLDRPFAMSALEENRLGAVSRLLPLMKPDPSCVKALEVPEPHVPWGRDWLAVRAGCYAATRDPRAARAAADLQTFQSRAPLRLFASGLRTRP